MYEYYDYEAVNNKHLIEKRFLNNFMGIMREYKG